MREKDGRERVPGLIAAPSTPRYQCRMTAGKAARRLPRVVLCKADSAMFVRCT
jgi:hypothetical protein